MRLHQYILIGEVCSGPFWVAIFFVFFGNLKCLICLEEKNDEGRKT